MLPAILGVLAGQDDDDDLPSPDAPDHVLATWLRFRHRDRRPPHFIDILELRAVLRARARAAQRRRAWWRWWRQQGRPRRPQRRDVALEFLASPEGQMLVTAIGGIAGALAAVLTSPDPWLGWDGRHPVAQPVPRRWRAPNARDVAADLLDYIGEKLAPGGRAVRCPGEADPAYGIPQPMLAAVNAANLDMLAAWRDRLRTALRGSPGPLAHALRRLGAAGQPLLAAHAWLGVPEPGPPRALLAPPEEEPAPPTESGRHSFEAPPGLRPPSPGPA